MKKFSRKPAPLPQTLLISLRLDNSIVQGLRQLRKRFPIRYSDGKLVPEDSQIPELAYSLLRVALANIDRLTPIVAAAVDYCEAEGIEDQAAYLNSMIDLKFRRW